jgi:hypothetical protein
MTESGIVLDAESCEETVHYRNWDQALREVRVSRG